MQVTITAESNKVWVLVCVNQEEPESDQVQVYSSREKAVRAFWLYYRLCEHDSEVFTGRPDIDDSWLWGVYEFCVLEQELDEPFAGLAG